MLTPEVTKIVSFRKWKSHGMLTDSHMFEYFYQILRQQVDKVILISHKYTRNINKMIKLSKTMGGSQIEPMRI